MLLMSVMIAHAYMWCDVCRKNDVIESLKSNANTCRNDYFAFNHAITGWFMYRWWLHSSIIMLYLYLYRWLHSSIMLYMNLYLNSLLHPLNIIGSYPTVRCYCVPTGT